MFSIKNLRYRYPNNQEDTIKEIDFEIKEGEIFGLLGPSGVGKSTTQKILTKQLDNFRGKISYQGKSISEYDKNFYQDIGVGFEMPAHFSRLTSEEVILAAAYLIVGTLVLAYFVNKGFRKFVIRESGV